MKEFSRRDLLKYTTAGIGVAFAGMAGYDIKRFLGGDTEKEDQRREDKQHILDTHTSLPTITGWKVNYPKQESNIRYSATEGQFADFHANAEITLAGNIRTGVYISDYITIDRGHEIRLNLQQKENPQWFLLQPAQQVLKDEHANTTAVQFSHPQQGFVYLGIWRTPEVESGNPMFRVQRMDKYRGY